MWNGTPSLRVVNPMCRTCEHTLKSHEESHCFMLLSSTNKLHMKMAQRIEPACHKGGVPHEMRNLPSYMCWQVIRNSQVQAFLMEPPSLPVPSPTTRGYVPLKVQTNITWLPKYYAPFKASPNEALQSANIATNWSKKNPSSIKWGPISNYILRKVIIHQHQLKTHTNMTKIAALYWPEGLLQRLWTSYWGSHLVPVWLQHCHTCSIKQ
jgi:hypothetical protein